MDLLRLLDFTHPLAWVVFAIVLVVALVALVLRWERYRPRHQPVHPLPTGEVFIDPESGRRLRVWVDPLTGARDYREDLDAAATALPPLHRPGLFLPPTAPPSPALPAGAEPPDAPTGPPPSGAQPGG